jgi:hypothetical protein
MMAQTILFVMGLRLSAQAQSAETLKQRVVQASHSNRINDVGMKPWHLKASFQFYDAKGSPSEVGVLEEWWAGLTLWKLRIESPSYTATIIENQDGTFRTGRIDSIPLRLQAIEKNLIYPMPMGEDVSNATALLRHEKFENITLDCIQWSEPPLTVQFPVHCLDPKNNALREIYSNKPWRLFRDHIEDFQGHSTALSITVKEGKLNTATAEVTDLSEIPLTDDLFTPSAEMQKVTNTHTIRITPAK